MPVELNHHIVASTDPAASAAWWAEMLGLGEPVRFGPFWQLTTANGVNLDFGGMAAAETDHAAALRVPGHRGRVRRHLRPHRRAGARLLRRPAGRQRGEINHNDGGRGVYFPDPDGHWLEIITRPYGG